MCLSAAIRRASPPACVDLHHRIVPREFRPRSAVAPAEGLWNSVAYRHRPRAGSRRDDGPGGPGATSHRVVVAPLRVGRRVTDRGEPDAAEVVDGSQRVEHDPRPAVKPSPPPPMRRRRASRPSGAAAGRARLRRSARVRSAMPGVETTPGVAGGGPAATRQRGWKWKQRSRAKHTVSPGQETLYRGISQKMLFVFVLGDVLGAGIYALVGVGGRGDRRRDLDRVPAARRCWPS